MSDEQWPADHQVGVYMQVLDGPPLLVGTARSTGDVPHLLRGIADEWQRKIYIGTGNGDFYGADATDTWPGERCAG